ncbi:MAG: sporulation protein YunB [Clostridia bacterium]|nr:sporulation protein YunB [Clostridia bacterium]
MRAARPMSRCSKRIIKIVCILLVLSVGAFCLFEFKARDLVHNLVDNELEIHAMNAIDNAVSVVLKNAEIDYDSLVMASRADDGSITSLQTNSAEINILKSQLSLAVTEEIRKDHTASVGVPAGAFTGLVLLSDIGPDIRVKLTLGGSAVTTIKSEFNSAGINQTVHRIYMIVDADISLTCPIIAYETNVISEYELCQTVIVGSTPQFFAGSR